MDKNIIDTFRIDTIFLNNLHYIRYYHCVTQDISIDIKLIKKLFR